MLQRFLHLVKSQKAFLICWLLLVMGLTCALSFVPKQELHLALNIDMHSAFGDTFFMYFTKVAEYAPYIFVIILLFYSFDWAITAALGQLGATLTTQAIKHFINAPRPKTFFETQYPELIPQLHWVDGVNMHTWLSFPSGHTTAFFSMFFLLSLLLCDSLAAEEKEKSSHSWLPALLQILCFVFALTGGYSRIYLSQHFAADVLAGCIVGVLLSVLFYCTTWQWSKSWSRNSLLNR